MRIFLPCAAPLLAGLLIAGCATKEPNFGAVPGPSGQTVAATPSQPPSAEPMPMPPEPVQPETKPIVTPDTSLVAKVVRYNSAGRFVVLDFPVGQMPSKDQTFFIYRGGLKVGEIKISGEQHDNFIVADLVNGEAQVGDEARDQ